MRIGRGQRGAGGGVNAQMDELPLAALQSPFDLPQGVGTTQLAKEHRHKLAPARQTFAASLGSCLLDNPLKSGAGE